MPDAVKHYQDTVGTYEHVRQVAVKNITMIRDVSYALQNKLPSFLSCQYSLKTQHIPFDKAALFNMKEWPDAETIKAALVAWFNAFEKMRNAWNALPEPDRIGLKAPPRELTLL
jgi:hypothetical protein